MGTNERLVEVLNTLVKEIEDKSCVPIMPPDSGCWFGEFSEYEENDHGDMIVEWPELKRLLEEAKQALAKEEVAK